MKKVVIYSLSALLVAGAAMSCRKTSKGKMSNEWELENWSESNTEIDNDGDKTVTTISSDGSDYTVTEANTPNGDPTVTETQTGTLDNFSFVIDKEGNWTRELGYTLVDDDGNTTTTTTYSVTEEGTWNFLGKVDEFKKNERVVFNTTSTVTNTQVTNASGGISVTNNYSSTSSYADGEMANVMLVVESGRKELELKSETDRSWTSTNSGTTSSGQEFGETTFTLVQPD